MKVGVVGASGYVGGETLRLLVNHPEVEISMVTSRQHVGEYLHRIQPSLKGFTDLTFSELDYDKLTDQCDVVFTAVPHGTATEIVKALYDRGIKVIDLSADYRLHQQEAYDKWYGWEHPHPDYLPKSVFGIPELHREEIKKAQLVSCPGCMAVTSILALAPLIKNDIIDTEHIIVDSKIGSSGAGSGSGTAHAMRAGVIRPYKPAKHRHTGEIEQELSEIAGKKIRVSMSPHAVDVVRGILCTNHTFMKKDIEEKELWKIYRQAYGDEKFIRLIRDKKGLYKFPDPKFLVGSNFCDIGFDLDEDNNRLIALSASDNLMKGAAGSAIQNMNVMCGFDEMRRTKIYTANSGLEMITIKIGGSVVDDLHPSTISDIKKIAESEGIIIVHGGGKEVTKVCKQLGKEPKFVTSPSGIKSRYTDKETAEIFTMVMSGRINKTIVQMLQKNGINAIGLSGVDAKVIVADRKKKLLIVNEKGRKQAIDGGYTGKIKNVNSEFIKLLLKQGLTPVISPVAISEESEFLNVDGDRAAAYVAGSVGSDKVLFITNVDGLLMDDKVVPKLTLTEAKEIRPKIGPGMEKKILASTEALDMGVKQAFIANGQKENPISSAIAHDNCTVIEHE